MYFTTNLLAIIISWIIFSFIVASIAKKKGRSWGNYFFLSLLLDPLIAFIVLLILGDSDEKRLEKIKQEEEMRVAIRKESGIDFDTSHLSNKYEDLEKLGNLLEKNLITKDEYEIEKKKILSDKRDLIVKPKEEDSDENLNFPDLDTLKELMMKSQNPWNGGTYRQQVIDLLKIICLNKANCKGLIKAYKIKFNSDIISDLKNLSSSYSAIAETLSVFIEFEILDKTYPHKLINRI